MSGYLVRVDRRWKDCAFVMRLLRRAFPERGELLAAVVQTWLWAQPAKGRLHDERCPLCSREFLRDVHRLVSAHSPEAAGESFARLQQGIIGVADTPRDDMAFRLTGFGQFERMARARGRLLCEHCARATHALLDDGAVPDSVDRSWADVVRALRADGCHRADAVEKRLGECQLAAATTSIEARRCDFCMRERRALVVPWHSICDDCAAKASAAASERS